MRIGVLCYPGKIGGSRLRSAALELVAGLEDQGFEVDFIDGSRELASSLAPYRYLCVGCTGQGHLSKRLPESLLKELGTSGSLAGRRAFGFTVSGLRSGAVIREIMASMEKEGLVVRNFQIFSRSGEGRECGRKLRIR